MENKLTNQIDDIFYSEVVEQLLPFEIITFQGLFDRHKNKLNDLFTCHRIHFNALFIITSGIGSHNIDCKEYQLRPGTILPIVKEQVHFFEKTLKVKGYIITFTDKFITDNTSEKNLFHFLQLYHSPNLQIDPENILLIQPFINLLFREQEAGSIYLKADLIKSIFISLLIQLKRLTPVQHTIINNQRFKDFILFKQLITKDISNSHNAIDYANKMDVSYNYLNNICKEIGGKTAKVFIDTWLVLEIKRNITEKKYTVKEIAYKMGFDEPTNFVRFFKKHTGITPRNFSLQI